MDALDVYIAVALGSIFILVARVHKRCPIRKVKLTISSEVVSSMIYLIRFAQKKKPHARRWSPIRTIANFLLSTNNVMKLKHGSEKLSGKHHAVALQSY